ncbi:MAG TPA: EAL domain-containing protein [Caulobacteraceae bacterium]|nr:EAL domain-containing protein [Caulobacteraceae bacterium]
MLSLAAPSLAPYQEMLTGIALVVATASAFALGRWTRARRCARGWSVLDDAMRGLGRGEPARVAAPKGAGLTALAERFNAMAEAVEERERVVSQLAASDPETGLPDRRALEAELAALAASGEPGVAVAAVSIDRFAELRATIGHERATSLFNDVAQRLAKKAPTAMVGRLASDTLGVIFGAGGSKAAQSLAAALAADLQGCATVDAASVQISLTSGVAPAAAATAAERSPLVRAAIAMEQARAARRKLAVFDAKAYGEPAANVALMAQMRRALEAGQIEVHHQPKYDIRQGRTVGVEALVRWAHPKRGLLSPGVFVRLAEITGQIRALTDYVLAKAVADQDALRRAGHELDMSVNITGHLLSDPDFIDHVLSVAGAAKGRLWLEVTDAAFADDSVLAMRHVARLAEAGVGISIDDYGAGVLSLARLREIRADEAKIDKSLILDLADDRQNRLLVRGAIELAHGLGMKVAAKGVETSEAYALLASMGCDFAQGFLIERAMPLDDLKRFLAEDRAGVRYG